MNRDEVWRAIDAQRLSLTDLLERLSDEEWRQPSLCDGWTVRDVAAHLTLQQVGLGSALIQMIRARGNVNRAIHDAACRRAALPTGQLIAEIRGMVGSRRRNAGVTYWETLIDILVHGQDIAVPLGRRHEMPPDAAAAAATRVWSPPRWPPYPIRPEKELHGIRLTATDVLWSVGDGAEVEGPIEAILLLLTGRLAVLPRLSGPHGSRQLRADRSRLRADSARHLRPDDSGRSWRASGKLNRWGWKPESAMRSRRSSRDWCRSIPLRLAIAWSALPGCARPTTSSAA